MLKSVVWKVRLKKRDRRRGSSPLYRGGKQIPIKSRRRYIQFLQLQQHPATMRCNDSSMETNTPLVSRSVTRPIRLNEEPMMV